MGDAGSSPAFTSIKFFWVRAIRKATWFGAKNIVGVRIPQPRPELKQGVGQSGRSFGLEPKGRGFKSHLPDQVI